MSFENQNEKLRWPQPGSIPEEGTDVLYHPVEGSWADRKNAWVVMNVTEENGATLVEIWHNYAQGKTEKMKVPLEELRRFNSKN